MCVGIGDSHCSIFLADAKQHPMADRAHLSGRGGCRRCTEVEDVVVAVADRWLGDGGRASRGREWDRVGDGCRKLQVFAVKLTVLVNTQK